MTALIIVVALLVVLAVALVVDWRRSGRIKQAFAEGKGEPVPGRVRTRPNAPGTAGHEAAALRDNQGHAGGI